MEEFAQLLQVNGINALPYHAGLDAKSRVANQDKFLMEEVDVIDRYYSLWDGDRQAGCSFCDSL